MNGTAYCHKALLQMPDTRELKIRRAADGTLVSDTGHTAAQVYRLYDATLDRAPDPDGLKHWVNAIQSKSLSLEQAMDGFTSSQEFQDKYGNQDNAGFVQMLYHNVLGRSPDEGGFRNWLNAIDNGMSRSEAMLGFYESTENLELTRLAQLDDRQGWIEGSPMPETSTIQGFNDYPINQSIPDDHLGRFCKVLAD